MADNYRPDPGSYDPVEEEKNAKAAATSGATSKNKLQSAGGLGSKVSGTSFKPPKMNPGEDSGSYGARVAAARREFEASAIEGQKRGIKSLP